MGLSTDSSRKVISSHDFGGPSVFWERPDPAEEGRNEERIGTERQGGERGWRGPPKKIYNAVATKRREVLCPKTRTRNPEATRSSPFL